MMETNERQKRRDHGEEGEEKLGSFGQVKETW